MNNYRISYYPESNFVTNSNGEIALRSIPESAVAYMKGTPYLRQSDGFSSPLERSNYHVDDDTLNSSVIVDGGVFYHKNNFNNFKYGTIKFEVKKEEEGNSNYSKQVMSGYNTDSFELNTPYAVKLRTYTLNTENIQIINLEYSTTPSIINIYTDLLDKLDVMDSEVTVNLDIENDNLEFISRISGQAIGIKFEVLEEEGTHNLSELFNEVKEPTYFNSPANDSNLFSLVGDDNCNSIYFIHKTDGKIHLTLTNETGEYTLNKELADYSFTNEEFKLFELEINPNTTTFYIDGKVECVFPTIGHHADDYGRVENITRNNPSTYLMLGGKINNIQSDSYSYKEFGVYNKNREESLLNIEHSYVVLNFGRSRVYDNKSLDFKVEGPFEFTMLDGSLEMKNTTDVRELKEFFEELELDKETSLSFETANDLMFRIEFKDETSVLKEYNVSLGNMDLAESSNQPYNFEDVFDFIRRGCGYPQVPVELTDEQLMDSLDEAVFEYKRYRDFHVAMDTVSVHEDLIMEEDGGIRLPPHISPDDVIDVLVKPRFTWAWFGGANHFMNNVFMQSFFRAGDIVSGASDMYIYRSSIQDVSNLMGTNFSWSVMNNKLYILPQNVINENVSIGLKYQDSISVDEIRNSMEIKKLALACAKIKLGTIRQTFGNSIPGGESTIQLNGDALIAKGEEEREKLIAEMKLRQEPLGFIWT